MTVESAQFIESEIERICDAIDRAAADPFAPTRAAERAARFPAILCWHELYGWPALGEARRRYAQGLGHSLPTGHRPLVLIATGFSS